MDELISNIITGNENNNFEINSEKNYSYDIFTIIFIKIVLINNINIKRKIKNNNIID